ncbi:MAG: hypothetical protein JWQ15_613 [Marmoricola sp.]|nr:hypothetical protein [Marmoricola sp.]
MVWFGGWWATYDVDAAESVLESARCPECLPTSVIVDHEKAGSVLVSREGYE